ncbi:hypothetical protein PFICI_04632 [Pestalotiopsis fici W106-1]|uniref:Uncharacterized protein n=1 Tax=Pestalotiopsis fici (strain W106-1 / CGMCC3.15140) TaxID=1229662 RepID=W3XC77_PESFW|nr:uncharacterized protein PFICI_04632 [Pestalotiopsis fici W106-1]ETS82756.1 hypothetical protein PFICI_04632 [Pestalotiopsis fici W106-1]
MCQGHTVRMLRCGHSLNHYSVHCGRRCWEPCAICSSAAEDARVHQCDKGKRGERCERDQPSGPEYVLDDFCSQCDPAWLLYKAKSLFEDRREQLEGQRRGNGPDPELDRILRALESGYLEARQKIMDKSPETQKNVPFLACVDMMQLGLSSRWVGKRCVWGDYPDDTGQLQRAQREALDTSWQAKLGWGSVLSNRSDSLVDETEEEEIYYEEEEEDKENERGPEDKDQVKDEYSEVDWLEIAELQIDEKQVGEKKSDWRAQDALPKPELDQLPSLLPPEMENHGRPGRDKEAMQAMASPHHLQPPVIDLTASKNRRPITSSDALSRWEEFRISKSIESLRRP